MKKVLIVSMGVFFLLTLMACEGKGDHPTPENNVPGQDEPSNGDFDARVYLGDEAFFDERDYLSLTKNALRHLHDKHPM